MILGYCRVSTDEQAADGATSLAEQERKCQAVAQLRSAGPYDFSVYTDAGVSGSIALGSRPAGREMLAEAKPGDTICAAKMDRLFRSASDALMTAEQLKARGIDLILIDMGTDPVTSNGVSRMFFGMLALVAEFERGRIAERMEEGRRGKRQRQGHVGGLAPYGFHVEGSGRQARLVPNPTEQEPVRVILDLSKEMRPYRVMKELHQRGFRDRLDKPFNLMQIKRIVAYHTREQDGRA